MILADKIIELRKKNGWSQEELAEMLGVSRQSVSKWEGAQSVPDMNRILKLSEVFGVSTDELLKDDLELPAERPVETVILETRQAMDIPEVRNVSMEEAASFFAMRLVSLGMETVLMFVTVQVMHLNDLVMKLVINLVVIVLNYVFSKLFIFKKK